MDVQDLHDRGLKRRVEMFGREAVDKRIKALGDFGKPEDLGPLAVYLASDASRYMTGAALVIDGGYTLW